MKSLVRMLLCLAAFSPLSMNAQFCGDCCSDSDYYFSAWAGGNVPFNDDHDLDNGWYAGGAIGYRCAPNMRYDLSFDYLRNDYSRDGRESSSSSDEYLNKYVILANAYYDFCPCSCFVPFVGGGIGYGYVKASNDSDFHKNTFAWQVGAGVKYEINECWSATAAYRLLGTTNDGTVYHNLFGLGLTRSF